MERLCDSGHALPGLRRGELSKKQETRSPRNKYSGQPLAPVTPSCCPSDCGFQPPPPYTALSVTCLLGLAGTFLGALSHTRPLSAVAAPLFTSELSGTLLAKHNEAQPARTQFQTQSGSSGTRNGLQIKETAQKKAGPLHGALASGPDNAKEKDTRSAHCWAGIPTLETALAGSPGNQSLSWREVGKFLRPYGWEPETWTSGPGVSL